MSVRDVGKVIILYNGLTGEPMYTMDYLEYTGDPVANTYFNNKITNLINNDIGCMVRIGNKSE